jgi:hypothetical protein
MDDLNSARHDSASSKLLLALIKAWMPIMDLRADVTKLVLGTSSRKFENLLGIPAMLVAAAGTVLLIVSTIKFEDALSLWFFWPMTIVGFAPVVGFILMNYAILWLAEAEYEAKYHEYWKFVHLEFDKKLDDYQKSIRARDARDD